MNLSDLEKLKAAYEASTPGEWVSRYGIISTDAEHDPISIAEIVETNESSVSDMEFILQSHTLMPELLRLAEKTLRENAEDLIEHEPSNFYVAYSAKEAAENTGAGFWSHSDGGGWVKFRSATKFTAEEILSLRPPVTGWLDSKWINADAAERLCYVDQVIRLYKSGQDNAYEVFLRTYGASHARSADESDLDFVRRCAEQDFADGETGGAIYQELYDEITGPSVQQTHSLEY